MRPNCCTSPLAGTNCVHCTAVRVGLAVGKNTFCAVHKKPLRYTTPPIRESKFCILSMVPDWVAKSAFPGAEVAQVAPTAAIALKSPYTCDPRGPDIVETPSSP